MATFSLVTDLSGLASSGEHGAALSASLAKADPQLNAQHLGLILGLYNIYSMLIALGYLGEEQVRWAPHHERSGFDAMAWSLDGRGLSSEAQSLISFLTCLSDDLVGKVPPIFAPEVSAQSFVGNPDRYIRDPKYLGNEGELLPAGYFQLSQDCGGHAPVLIYNTLEGKAGWWDLEDSWTGSEAVKNIKWRPAGDLLNAIAQRLLDLDLVPVPSIYYPELHEPPLLHEAEMPETDPPRFWHVNEINKFRAFQNIYRVHGWPSTAYKREDAVAALQEFNEACFELECSFPYEKYMWRAHRGQAEEYWTLLSNTAGDMAVRTPSFEQCSDPSWARGQAAHGDDI